LPLECQRTLSISDVLSAVLARRVEETVVQAAQNIRANQWRP
jgi:hypothetical protein